MAKKMEKGNEVIYCFEKQKMPLRKKLDGCKAVVLQVSGNSSFLEIIDIPKDGNDNLMHQRLWAHKSEIKLVPVVTKTK